MRRWERTIFSQDRELVFIIGFTSREGRLDPELERCTFGSTGANLVYNVKRISVGKTMGYLRSEDHRDVTMDMPWFFKHDPATLGGNSGSPVLNARGEIVGVHSAGVWWEFNAATHPLAIRRFLEGLPFRSIREEFAALGGR